MSLRLRLALFIALAIALALLVQGFLGYASFERLQMGNLERELGAYLDRIVDQLEGRRGPRMFRRDRDRDETRFSSSSSLERLRENAPRLPLPNPAPAGGVASARLVREGQVWQEWGSFPEAIPPSENPEPRLEQNWLYQSVRLGPGVYLQGAIEASQVRASLAGYQQTVLFTALVVALLGAWVAWLVSGPALRPLRHLQEATRRVADSGDLSLRVPAEGSGELLQLSQTFNQMLERLSAFRQRETQFTRNAAHELRTPLTAMRLQLDSQQQGLASPEETLAVVREEVERMSRLSESLLTLAREGRGQKVGLDSSPAGPGGGRPEQRTLPGARDPEAHRRPPPARPGAGKPVEQQPKVRTRGACAGGARARSRPSFCHPAGARRGARHASGGAGAGHRALLPGPGGSRTRPWVGPLGGGPGGPGPPGPAGTFAQPSPGPPGRALDQAGLRGSCNSNKAPPSERFWARTCPPCSSTRVLTMESPRPLPPVALEREASAR
ncbi:MAG: hypothetical protein KatS3mg073_0496 [Meiothermus sp.]|nr:MAG: hypothetical protein KatS3mg073_0496 [Meiothermus sp.]